MATGMPVFYCAFCCLSVRLVCACMCMCVLVCACVCVRSREQCEPNKLEVSSGPYTFYSALYPIV